MTGALAMNFAFSGIPFQLQATSLDGDRFVQYAVPDRLAQAETEPLVEGLAAKVVGSQQPINNVTKQDGTGTPYASDTVSQIGSATIKGLHQTVCAPTTRLIPGLPSIRVHIRGVDDTTANRLTIQAPALAASQARFNDIIIGGALGGALNRQNLPNAYPELEPTILGSFSQDATTVHLENINQVGIGTEAGMFSIGGLRLWAEFTDQCY
jgi:hypothetical protein